MTTSIAAEALSGRLESSLDEMKHIEDQWGSDRASWPTGQAERYDRKSAEVARLNAELEDVTRTDATRAERIEAIRAASSSGAVHIEEGFHAPDNGGARRGGSDPWAYGAGDNLLRVDSADGLAARAQSAVEQAHGLTPQGRELLANVITNDDDSRSAALVIAATSDAYRSAFEKVLRDSHYGALMWTPPEREAYSRVETARAAMSLTSANGGFLVPFSLDPTIMLSNVGAASPFRQHARIETTITDTWNGVTSAGVNAQWLAENGAATDASPTFARATVTPKKGSAYLMASYEVAMDTNIAAQIPALIQDARLRQEATAFCTGNGTTEPEGIITAVSAVGGSKVAPVTGGTFAVQGDVYKVWDALTPRARQSTRLAWAANNAYISKIRQFDTAGGSAYIAGLGDGQPPRLLGAPLYEASAMTATMTTGSAGLIAGDLSEFLIVDRIGTTVVPVPAVVDTNGMPTGTAGWFCFWRVGSKVTNTDAFRLLVL